mgnify:CR=1 FL=1
MERSYKILSTKLLPEAEKAALLSYDYTEKAFINIALNKNFLVANLIDFAVFTSPNAVKAIFEDPEHKTKVFKQVFCVGEKTAQLLKTYTIDVHTVCLNAVDLAKALIQTVNKSDLITFFCGNLRRDELPDLLRDHEIEVQEIEVYTTTLVGANLNTTFDAVLFFSPSAVKSYVASGNNLNTIAFCIGTTTAVAAIMELENVYVAERPTVASVFALLQEVLPTE